MKIIRYTDSTGTLHYGALRPDGSAVRCTGDLHTGLSETGEVADVKKLLAPIQPSQILCIGLNYRHHAAESGMAAPERPVLFTKGINTLQNPGDPIEIPVHAASHEVDYECELAVVIGKSCKNATGWDRSSAILEVFTEADQTWRTYRLPKASQCFDHKWQTEWPRIRSIEHERLLMDHHGMWYELSPWAYGNRVWGIRPISTHLWVHGDFCA
jgi:2-keto-4-pentenoate hydratase/2-oxohepta-3-ene-1,7-dioic acid hydratase in catechol pathway